MKLLNFFYLTVFLLCAAFNIQAQVTFQRMMGGSQSDLLNAMVRTPDACYLLAGSTQSYGGTFAGDKDMYLVKTDSQGHVIWSKTYGNGSAEAAFAVEAGSNGYYLLGTSADSITDTTVAELIHTDTAGNIIWDKTYSMYTNGQGLVMKKLSANAYMIVGAAYTPTEDNEVFLMKIDSSGNVLWTKGYNGAAGYRDVPHGISTTGDGGFLITGDSYRSLIHDFNIMAIKTDSLGNAQWINTYASSLNSRGYGGYETADHGFVLGGQYINPGTQADLLMIRTDNTGNVLWNKKYGSTDKDMIHSFLTTGSGYAFVGETSSFSNDGTVDGLLLQTDMNGNITMANTYGDVGQTEELIAGVAVPGGFAMGGSIIPAMNGYGIEDFYFVKKNNDTSGCFEAVVNVPLDSIVITPQSYLDTDNSIVPVVTAKLSVKQNGGMDTVLCFQYTPPVQPQGVNDVTGNENITIYPDPSTGTFYVEMAMGVNSNHIHIYNAIGQDVSSLYHIAAPSDKRVTITNENAAPGNYWVRVADNTGKIYVKQIVLQ